MNPEDCPGAAIRKSEGSKAGRGFLAADNNRIANEGETELNLVTGQRQIRSTFQMAKVSRPLMSVGKICDAGHKMLFDSKCAIVYDLKGKEICRFMRKGGLYLIKFRIKRSGFTRPGGK